MPLATKPGLIGKHFMGLKLVFQSKQCELARINWKPHGAQAQREQVGLAGEEIGGCGDPLLWMSYCTTGQTTTVTKTSPMGYLSI